MTLHEPGADHFDQILIEALGHGEPSIRVRQAVLRAAAAHNRKALRRAARRPAANWLPVRNTWWSAPAGQLTQASSALIEASHNTIMRVRLMM